MGTGFGLKTYICVCHGCGKFHEKEAYFLSVPMAFGFDHPTKPDTRWSVPALGCPECMSQPLSDEERKNRKGKIAQAWDHGSTPEARERANKEFIEWLPKLEAKHASNR